VSEQAEPERVYGWKDIANLLEISVRSAQERARRAVDPLPIRLGHRGVWAYVSALRDWVMRQDVAYAVVAASASHVSARADRAQSSPSGRAARVAERRPNVGHRAQ
jgi:hypothetical protein